MSYSSARSYRFAVQAVVESLPPQERSIIRLAIRFPKQVDTLTERLMSYLGTDDFEEAETLTGRALAKFFDTCISKKAVVDWFQHQGLDITIDKLLDFRDELDD